MAVKYDKNTDYKALMEAAAKAGDYASAAKYEQQRNAKIQDMNAAGGGTNPYGAVVSTDYAQYLGGGYSPAGNYNDAGLSAAAQEAVKGYQNQYYNAMSLNDQAGMDEAHAGAEAIRAANGYSGGTDGSEYIGSGNTGTGNLSINDIAAIMGMMQSSQPSYQSQYNTQIDAMLNNILNREDFSYDAESDPLYQQYRTQYQREGQRARDDTLATVASGAGGMNSYAVTAAQQANDYYNAQMTDKIPELYQLAYDMYLQDIDNQVRDLGLLQQMDDTQYGRYRDTMSDWRNDLDFAYGAYRDDVADSKWQKEMDYAASRDAVSDAQWNKTFDYNAGRDTIADQQWRESFDTSNEQWQQQFDASEEQRSIDNANNDRDYAYQLVMENISRGIMPTGSLLAAAGLTPAQVSRIAKANAAKDEAGGIDWDVAVDMAEGGQFTNDVVNAFLKKGYTVEYLEEMYGYEPPTAGGEDPYSTTVSASGNLNGYVSQADLTREANFYSAARPLDLSAPTAEVITKLAEAGAIYEDKNGQLQWSNGWNKDNWEDKLKSSFRGTLDAFGYNN